MDSYHIDPVSLAESICSRPKMWTATGRLEEVMAFFYGYEIAISHIDALPRLKARGIQRYWRTMRSEPRLTCSRALDNALPSGLIPQPELVFFLEDGQTMRTLDFTPSDSSFPIKLPSLRSFGTFRSLPTQLLSGTLRNPSVLKNLRRLYLAAAPRVACRRHSR